MTHLSVDRIQVGVLHSEPLIAAGVLHSLSREADIDVVAAPPHSWRETHVLVTDLATGLRLAGELRGPHDSPAPVRLLVLAARDREVEIRRAMESGVHGYLLASCDAGELVRGIRAVGAGARYLSTEVARRVADSMSREQLTAREFDVLQLLIRGLCNKAIARALSISIGTVKTHVKAVMGKLDATSRTHAVSLAVERGLVQEDVAA